MTEWIISSSVLIAAVLIMRRILQGRLSPGIQYALWGIVLLRLLMPFSLFSSNLSVQNIPEQALKRPEVQQLQQVIQAPIRPQESVVPPQNQPAARPEDQSQQEQSQTPQTSPGQATQQSPSGSESVSAQSLSLGDLALYVWTAGMVGLGFWLVWCNAHFAIRLKRSREPLDIPHSLLPVYRSAAVESPCLFGLFSPGVYLTEKAVEDPVVQAYVLTHELTHYRQMDHIWSVLRAVALILHWYNPLVWIAFRVSRQDCEMACDARTLRELGEEHRGNYGRTLVGLATGTRFRGSLVTATSMGGSKSAMKERIVILMKNPKTAMITMVSLILVCALIVGCTFTGAVKDPTEDSTEDPTEDPAQETTEPVLPFDTLGQLLTDRLGGDYVYTVTELDSGITYHPLSDGLFNFTGSKLLLDWENAVSNVIGFWEDSDIMVEIRQPDGSFYIQLHNGTNANWIYISECDKYVPLKVDPDGMPYNNPSEPINTKLAAEYDAYIVSARYIDHFGNGEPKEAVALLTEALRQASLEVRNRSLSGNYDYADVEVTGVVWNENEDGSLTVSGDIFYRPRAGQKASYSNATTWEPDGSIWVMFQKNLFRLEDGYWYMDANQDGEVDWDPEIIPTEPESDRIPSEIEEMFRYDHPDYRWLYQSTQCIFEDPTQIDLFVLLYNGFDGGAGWHDFDPEEQHAVEEQLGSIYTTVDRLPAAQIDEILRKYFGVALGDVQIPEQFAYYAGSDSYYHRHGDVLLPDIELETVEWINDTNFRIYYTQNSAVAELGEYPMGEYDYGVSMVMHLRNVDGLWQPLFNLPVDADLPAEPIPEEGIPLTDEQIQLVNDAFDFIRWQEDGEYYMRTNPISSFFLSQYERPEQIDLTQFLRYFSSYGIYEYSSVLSEEEFYALRDLIGAEERPFRGITDYEAYLRSDAPIHRIPREAVDAVLMRYAGITVDSLRPSDICRYLEEFDCYYTFTSDFGPGEFHCIDGRIYNDYAVLYSNDAALTLVLDGQSGAYRIYSHLPR